MIMTIMLVDLRNIFTKYTRFRFLQSRRNNFIGPIDGMVVD